MANKKLSLNELRKLVKQIIKEETQLGNQLISALNDSKDELQRLADRLYNNKAPKNRVMDLMRVDIEYQANRQIQKNDLPDQVFDHLGEEEVQSVLNWLGYSLTDSGLEKTDSLDENENENLSDSDKKITTSYYVVDEESAEMGDAKERGWYDKEGESMTPDEFDDEDVTAVDKAVEFLLKNGATVPSSSNPGPNLWFSTPDPDRDYSSGEDTYYDYHLNGFTPEEVIEIFNRIKQKREY